MGIKVVGGAVDSECGSAAVQAKKHQAQRFGRQHLRQHLDPVAVPVAQQEAIFGGGEMECLLIGLSTNHAVGAIAVDDPIVWSIGRAEFNAGLTGGRSHGPGRRGGGFNGGGLQVGRRSSIGFAGALLESELASGADPDPTTGADKLLCNAKQRR